MIFLSIMGGVAAFVTYGAFLISFSTWINRRFNPHGGPGLGFGVLIIGLVLPVALTLQLCYAGARRAPVPVVTPSTSPSPLALGIHFAPIHGIPQEIARVQAAEVKINEMIASPCFEDFFRSRKLVQTALNGKVLTNMQVIDAIRGARVRSPIVYYYQNTNVAGYRNPPSDFIYVNRKFHNSYSVCSEASGNGHEALHVLGFDHDFNRTARRPYSVPYSWNAMALVCCKEGK